MEGMTVLEKRFMECGVSFFTRKDEPDWEERKFELVKSLLAGNADATDSDIEQAIDTADRIITRLKK